MSELLNQWLRIKIGFLWLLTDVQSRGLMIVWALDHAALALLTLGHCRPYEMISSALWAQERKRRFVGIVFRPIVDFLLRPLGPSHCEKSYIWQRHIYQTKP